MEQVNSTTNKPSGQHLNLEKRIRIEALKKVGISNKDIAAQIGCCERTIRRELKRGEVTLLNTDWTERVEYSADIAQKIHDDLASNKGPREKIGNDYELADYFEDAIGKQRMSPYAAVENIKNKELEFNHTICFKTLYNYIDRGLFLNISNKDLPVKKNGKKRPYKRVNRIAWNNPKGTGISERPKEIDTREEYGHWEMDTVVGKKGTATVLMVLTERKTRQEIVFKIPNKTEECVVKELDKLERKMRGSFSSTFKTITCDNGSENLDFVGIERSAVYKNKARTKVYYAHPYSAYERGSNENANKLIRRFIPKGMDISKISKQRVKWIENWINNYPRRILGGQSSKMYLENL